jgi:flagellin
MRELAVQSANGTNGTSDQAALDGEFQQMSAELDRISQSTNLNGVNLLDGTAGTAGVMTLQVGSGTGTGNTIDLDLSGSFSATGLGVNASVITTAAGSTAAMDSIDTALQTINDKRAALGASQNRLTSTISNLQNINENATAALGRIQDTDFAAETANLTKQQTLQQASTAVLAQANQLPSAVLKLLQ